MQTIRELQRALELAHYARRHRGKLHVVAVAEPLPLADFLLDLELLDAYGLRGLVVARGPGADQYARMAATWQRRAGIVVVDADNDVPTMVATARPLLERGQTPLLLLPGRGAAEAGPGDVERLAGELALALRARRLLMLAPASLEGSASRPHLTREEARTAALETTDAASRWLRFGVQLVDRGLPGLVLLPGETGCIFEELFTHHGAGTLIGDPVAEGVRPAGLADVDDVRLLLRGEMSRGVIRPVTDEDLQRTIGEHVVYTIDGVVVGTARLAPWGEEAAELARFATLPRYRGRGRARVICLDLVERARTRGFRRLFALSIDERMWRFFESVGFTATDRATLPDAWKAGYDFSRPSRAFALSLV
jgi:N-acetylglutamate synthase-like GNAT family acetyltransferase